MIAIGSDHGGYELKREIIQYLEKKEIPVLDCGCYSPDAVDYPDVAVKVCDKVTGGECELGILICGTGIGISMAANKMHGIRAALCHSTFDGRMARMHNNANVLCLGGRTTGVSIALDIVDAFVSAEFEGGRHEKRVGKIMSIEE